MDENIELPQPEEKHHSHPHEFSKAYLALLEDLKAIELPESKLEKAIVFMRDAIAQGGTPHFKEFWEAKRLVLELFKEHINPSIRVHLWSNYSEICREAKSLKDLLDEQSSFACEQIDMAVAALEEDIAKIDERLKSLQEPELFVLSVAIEANKDKYTHLQKELNLYNAHAARISALRKELMRTEIRLRTKNKLFDRLSALGDVLFPKRKSLIREVSELFEQDVDAFIQNTFIGELKTAELFDIREEIKALQGIAKALTLNTEIFTKTRKQLSECWDSIREVVTERKKATHDLKAQHRQNRDEIAVLLQDAEAKISSMNPDEALQLIDQIHAKIRATPLGRQDVFALKDQMHALKSRLYAQKDDERNRLTTEKQQLERARVEKVEEVSSRLKNLLAQIESKELVGVQEAIAEIGNLLSQLDCSKREKMECDRLLRKVEESFSLAQEDKLLHEDGDTAHKITSMRQVLEERKKRRSEVKARIESLRKSSASNLDFSQAMEVQEAMQVEREKLQDLETGILEIERALKSGSTV